MEWRTRGVPVRVGLAAVALLALAGAGYAAGRASGDGGSTDVTTRDAAATPDATAPAATTPASTSTTTSSTTTASTTTATSTTSGATPEAEPTDDGAPRAAPPEGTAPASGPPGNEFPVRPASAASYARSHHDYPAADIFAACGLEVVAPASGTVQEVTLSDVWSSGVNSPETRGGLSFSIVGDDGVRYYGSHLGSIDDAVRPGARLAVGERIGTVGDSGNAAGTGCHLHFGISTPCGPGDVLRRRGEFWPQEYLDAWRSGIGRSPADRVRDRSC